MQASSILLFVVMATVSSCAIHEKKEPARESGSTSMQPKALDDAWSKWIVGEWEGSVESDVGTGKIWQRIDLGLNGQFLVMSTDAGIAEISDRQRQYLKDTFGASDEDIAGYRGSTDTELQMRTLDSKTGKVVGYLFDSFRCIAEGRGRRQGDKEIIE